VPFRWILFDWGDTLMHEEGGPVDVPMALWPEVRPLPGAREVLARLAVDLRIGVATNATVSDRAHILQALARAGLDRYLALILCYRDLGVKKADPAFWSAALASTAAAADEIVMVGDDLDEDVLAPRRAGIAAIWLNWKRAPAPAGLHVPTLERLADVPGTLATLGPP